MSDEGEGMRKPTHDPRPTIHAFAAASLALLASGCANVDYYWQSVSGQLEVWRRERPVAEVLADPAAAQALKDKLARVLEIRAYASRELGLPDNQSYRRYADLERPFVVWNVFAAPEFSVEPLRWCLAFAGCVNYRGYFERAAAEQFAAELARQGHEVYVGGVPAYSTLGWFDDPVLNTFIHYPDVEIARLVFHELAHQVAYAKDDTAFNESFATAVEQEGVRRWVARAGDARQLEEFERNRRARTEFAQLVQKVRGRLEALYRTRLAPEAMRERKSALLAELEAEYRGLKAGWGGVDRYDRWFARQPNNAQLASVGLYTQRVPAFEALLLRESGDLERFYAAVKELAALPKEQRDTRLNALLPGGGT
jgi:predicted aminopeptidase